jgi:hypothetical protein
MDLGTTVLPLSAIRVQKVVDKAIDSPGDIVTYTMGRAQGWNLLNC